jgi:hypothetical protein
MGLGFTGLPGECDEKLSRDGVSGLKVGRLLIISVERMLIIKGCNH